MNQISETRALGARPGPLRRIKATDAIAARQILSMAFETIEPEDRTQRQLFAALMPELYLLRTKGFSFAQLAGLLNESGFKLQPSTVRVYYYEMLADKMQLCEQRFNEQMAVLAQVREITNGAEISTIAARVTAAREAQQGAIAAKVDAVFKKTVGVAPPVSLPAPRATTIDASAEPLTAVAAAPGTSADDSEAAAGGEFGLMAKNTSTRVAVKPGAGFFDLAEPLVPVLDGDGSVKHQTEVSAVKTSHVTPEEAEEARPIKCVKLHPDVPMLDRRAGVPDEVYSEGILEHPAVPGLMLSKAERLYSQLLEFIDGDGAIRQETLNEKRYRIKWMKPIKEAQTASKRNFVPYHKESFKDGELPE